MESYKFTYKDREYELSDSNLDYFANDEDISVSGIDTEKVIQLLRDAEEVSFDLEYYDSACDKCLAGKAEKAKAFKFLEYHFFIFTKGGNYVTSTISKEFKTTSATQLFKLGRADNSYIVSIAVCESCGSYFIEIEQCEI